MLTRRSFLQHTLASTSVAASSVAGASLLPSTGNTAESSQRKDDSSIPVTFALNMSTIRGQKLSILEQIDVAAEAGYDGIEPWIRDLELFVKEGGKLPDLQSRISDNGLTVDSAIGFAKWIVDDPNERAEGLETARRDMETVAQIGGTLIAAPPVGAHGKGIVSPSLTVIADRYRALLELGQETGVTPQLELWGFSPTLSKLSDLIYVATAAEHADACVLPDFYHIYKGGNDFKALGMIEASRMHCFHINDYPSDPPIDKIGDKHRVFPGDGICPLPEVIAHLIRNGFSGTFSLELFNPDYWKRDAVEVAKEGLEKSRNVVAKAMDLV